MSEPTVQNHDKEDMLLSVRDLHTRFWGKQGSVTVLDGISFDVAPGEIVCIVGESGCGKSTVAMSLMRLLASNGEIYRGSAVIHGKDLFKLSENEMCDVRGNTISMIFQDPMQSLNPTMTIGKQLAEAFRVHRKMSSTATREASLRMLDAVGIPSPEKRLAEYPHQLSGGMRQRVMISMALALGPDLLIADEPTTALDVTIQAQILDLMRTLRTETGAAILFITHDLGVVAEMSDRVLVLYAGKTMEHGRTTQIFAAPKHPYTQGLLRSLPRLETDVDMLPVIEGAVPSPGRMPAGCPFEPRCPHAMAVCRTKMPPEVPVGDALVACFLYPEKEGADGE